MSETAEAPPPPGEVLDESRIRYQAMTDLDDAEYARLAADIREHGVLQPVIVDDTDDQVIIDGHHREAIAEHYDLPPERRPAYVVVAGLDDDAKLSRAIKQNLIGRDTTDAVKRHAVKQYIELAWEYDDDADALVKPETQQAVAEKLGVSRNYVSEVLEKVDSDIIQHDRLQARRYYEDHPDASYREVARQVDADHTTVTEWLKEDFDEGDSDDSDGGGDDGDPDDDGGEEDDAEEDDEGDDNESDIDQFTSQDTDEWSSPREIVEPLADAVGGFDLDPCSGAEQSPFADETYTEADDGLDQPWHGAVWVNPPYSEVADWTEKVATEFERDAIDSIYYLCKGDSSTDWWHDAIDAATLVVAIDHRLSFGDGENSAPFASHIFVFGRPGDAVLDVLAGYGAVLTTLRVGGGGSE